MAGQTSAEPRQQASTGSSVWLLFERKVLLNLATILFLLATAIMLFEGICRAAFDSSAFWAEEGVRYLMIWAFFLTLGVAGHSGNHIRTELLVEHLGPRLRRLCHVLSSWLGCCSAGCCFMPRCPRFIATTRWA